MTKERAEKLVVTRFKAPSGQEHKLVKKIRLEPSLGRKSRRKTWEVTERRRFVHSKKEFFPELPDSRRVFFKAEDAKAHYDSITDNIIKIKEQNGVRFN